MPAGHLPVRSYLATPVVTSDGAVAGGLFFGHPDVGVFDAHAERIAVGIGAHAAIAIENARLYAAAEREIAARRQAFEERDKVARTLQQSLLPPHDPKVPGLEIAADYHPAGEGVEVVGDFYDVFAHGPDRWAIVIGDVCGKGIEAAKVTALARHTVRAAAMHSGSPAEVLRTLNQALNTADTGGLFLTAIYVDLDLRDGAPVATIACAGHPPALIRMPDGAVVTTHHHGPLLGAFADVELSEEVHVLAPGSSLLLVTDGVVEARVGGELFGEQRLQDVLVEAGDSARDIVQAVGTAVAGHAGDQFADDLAIVAVRVPLEAAARAA
jgi:serine phosphatase RsbU (regulator of sigma subunit)